MSEAINKMTDESREISQSYDGLLFWRWNRDIPGKLGQYHACWCSGSLRRQGITSHAIDHVE